MSRTKPLDIPPSILRSSLMRQGGFGGYEGVLDVAAVSCLRAEAAEKFRSATSQQCYDDDGEDARGGMPRRSLLSAEAGEVQDHFYRSMELTDSLSEMCGIRVAPSGNRGSYSYYVRPGDFLDLHRDIETCDLAVITGLHDNSDASELSGALVLYPDRVYEPLSAIRTRLHDGAQAIKLGVGQTIVMFGGIIPHWVMPVRRGQMRIISVLCFQAVVDTR